MKLYDCLKKKLTLELNAIKPTGQFSHSEAVKKYFFSFWIIVHLPGQVTVCEPIGKTVTVIILPGILMLSQ